MTELEKRIIEKLKIAIKGNYLISFIYDEEVRKVEPYLVGELYSIHQNHLEEGTYALRAWFVSGYSSKPVDKKNGDRWRIYELNKMKKLVILDETNKKLRPLYNPNDKKIKRINFRVEKNNLFS